MGGKFVGTGLLLRCEVGGSGNPLLWSLRTFRELLLRREVGDTPHATLILTVPKTPLPRAIQRQLSTFPILGVGFRQGWSLPPTPDESLSDVA